MNNSLGFDNLTKKQKGVAIQRLTALWAFAESGLGGMLHALQMPFTGLVVGGLAVIIITLIAKFSDNNIATIFKSLAIVLIIKLSISPYTPFPAYIAVSFQALTGCLFFSIMKVNYVSVLLLSIISMIESAIQKLLILTLIFGQSLWKATDAFFSFVANQFNYKSINGANWLIGIYLAIYILGGILIALFALKTIRDFKNISELPLLINDPHLSDEKKINKRKNRLVSIFIILCTISAILFFFNKDEHSYLSILKVFSWTITAIFLWYYFITPLFTKLIVILLQKSKSKYSTEVSDIISMTPQLKNITYSAWVFAKHKKGFSRIALFLSCLLQWSLTYIDKDL